MRTHWLTIIIGIMFICGALIGCQEKSATPESTQLTIFSWWTAGGEADGLNELIKLFKQANPNVEVINAAVAGGAGTNAKAVLKTRMLGGDPPSTFQVHGGAELLETWVSANLMGPITPLIEEQNLRDKFPAQLWEMVSHQGQIYAIPANIHRGNVMWFNKNILDENEITLPTTIGEWLFVCKKLKKAGITPLALASRNKWPVTHLFENLLLAAGDASFYNDLFAGKILWTDTRVKLALATLSKLLDYTNEDHAALTWDQASGLVLQGKAAMNVMGDWAKGYFLSNQAKPNVDFGAAPTPGTVGSFFVITDTFGLPAKAPDQALSMNFLKIVASAEGQINFNLKKGSIPARTDVPMDQFDEIARATMADFAANTLVPSCAHGSAVVELFVTELNDQLSVFLSTRDIEQTVAALAVAAGEAIKQEQPQ